MTVAYTRLRGLGVHSLQSTDAKNIQNNLPGGSGSPEWAALLQCASPHYDLSILSALLSKVSWPALVTLAEAHGVISLLASSLGQLPENLVPPEFAHKIRELHRAQVLSALQMTAELFRLADQFRDAGLDVVLVKGPTLALRAYGDTGARQYGDLAFSCAEKYLRATKLMISAGYKPEIAVESLSPQKIPGQYLFRSNRSSAPGRAPYRTHHALFPSRASIEEFVARRQLLASTATTSPPSPSKMS